MPDQRSKRQSRKQRRQRRRQRGGDAASWAGAVYGQAGAQIAAPGGGNVIAAQNLAGVNMCSGGGSIADNAAPFKGGNSTAIARPPTGGKGILTDVAVPAVLVYANNVFKGKNKSKGGNSNAVASPPVTIANPPPTAATTTGGKGLLTDVAVPAVLLYANNTFKGRKTHGKRSSRSRRSRKNRR